MKLWDDLCAIAAATAVASVTAPALSKVRRAGEIGSSIVSSPHLRMLILQPCRSASLLLLSSARAAKSEWVICDRGGELCRPPTSA